MKQEDDITHLLEQATTKAQKRSNIRSVIAGISGGADSTAMLHLLVRCRVTTEAVHCNFHLRGEESERDCQFVKDLCQKLNVPLHVVDFDVKAHCAAHHESIETACRNLRYDEFRRILKEKGFDRICVAHNADDQAETLLLNLFRGAGLRGLGAMKQDSGEIFRPLLSIPRKEILQYLAAIGEEYVVDSTNQSSDYRRNFIRNEVIPLIRTRWEGIDRVLCRTAIEMQSDEQLLEDAYRLFTQEKEDILILKDIWSINSGKRIISTFAHKHGATRRQGEEMQRLLDIDFRDLQSGKKWIVRNGIIIFQQGELRFVSPEDRDVKFRINHCRIDKDAIESEIAASDNASLLTSLSPEQIEFRYVAVGDRISPIGMRGSILLSKVMKDAKLPIEQRERIVVAVEKATNKIIWLEGLKRSRHQLVDIKDGIAYKYWVER